MSQSTILKRNSPVYLVIRKYNFKLAKKLQDQKESTAKAMSRWQTFGSSLDERPNRSEDGDIRKQVYLHLISDMHEQQRMLSSLIDLKHLVNHNEGKITVVRAKVHGVSDVEHPALSDSNAELEIEEMEDRLREAEEERYDLESEINGMRTKNNTIEREVNRNTAEFDHAGIDEDIRDAKRMIEKLEDML